MTKKSTTSNAETEDPSFPMTARINKKKKNGTDTAPDFQQAAAPPERITEHEEPQEPKDKQKEEHTVRKDVDKSLKEAEGDPVETYENWREKIFKPGLHKVKVWYREPDSKTYVNANPPFWDSMLTFEDLCIAHSKGALIRLAIYKPNAYGRMLPITGPIDLPIAPQGEYQMSGFGNPFKPGNSADPATFSMDRILTYTEKQADKREAQQTALVQSQQQMSNTWLNALISAPKKTGDGMDQNMLIYMMQSQQQAAQAAQAAQQAQTNLMINMMQQNTQLLVAAMKKDDDPITAKLFEIQQSQNNLLLQQALGKTDIKEQLEVLKTLQGLSEPSTLGEIAKLAEALDVGSSLKALTGATAERIRGTEQQGAQQEPMPRIPEGAAQPAAQPQPVAQPAAQLAAQQPPQATEQQSGIQTLLNILQHSYLSGHQASEVAETFIQANPTLSKQLANQDHQNLFTLAIQYCKEFGYTDLLSTGGKDFVLDFLKDLKEGSNHDTKITSTTH